MNSLEQIQTAFADYLKSSFNAEKQIIDKCLLTLNVDETKQQFGDLTTNAALMLSKQLKTSPLEIAKKIASGFNHPLVEKIEIAGPGFVNLYLFVDGFRHIAQELFEQKEQFFKPTHLEQKNNVSIEFVSANPTGPLHFGHGRGGIIGDVLGNILRFLGHDVTKEFYINDAGSQIQKLGASLKARCLQITGTQAQVPEDGYQGDYLIDLAKDCFAEYGHTIFEKEDVFFADYAKNALLEQIKDTLSDYGITFDVWFSEKTLHESGAVAQAVDLLGQSDRLYEKDGALWFKTTDYGDDKDRVVKKASGEYTYIAADIAYLKNKADRGFNNFIFILGHDHHSYVIRLESVKQALGLGSYPLDVILYQLVKITESGQLVRMSKRAGTMITLQDIINTVGKDVARFFYLNRKADAQLEFDIDLALKKTEENPVYYVQYAYVRTNSLLQKALHDLHLSSINAKDAQFIGREELFLLKKIVHLKQILMDISTNHQTHLLTYYVLELAQLFHRYYSHVRIIDPNNREKTRGRLLMVIMLKNSFGTILTLLGISNPEKM